MKKYVVFVAVFLIAVSLSAQDNQSENGTVPGASSAPEAVSPDLVIGPGDLLDINVFDVPELILKVRVSDAGDVSLPLVGNLRFAGLSTVQAERLLARQLVDGDFVKKPEISILISEYATQGITISGEVNQPGIYPLLGPHRLYDAISAAGGLTPRAGRTVTIVHKAAPDDPTVLDLPRDTALLQANIQVVPGDTIIVSKAGVVYAVGEVVRPGAFLMETNTRLTILQVIALSQGPTRTAALNRAQIVRRTPQGLKEIPVQLDKILKARAPDHLLEPDDIVFLPSSKIKGAGQLSARSVVAVAASLAVFAVR